MHLNVEYSPKKEMCKVAKQNPLICCQSDNIYLVLMVLSMLGAWLLLSCLSCVTEKDKVT